MISQTELLAWSEPDTKFFADNLLGVEDWGDSIADMKFNSDDLFLRDDRDVEIEERDDQLKEFLSSLGDPSSPIDDFNFSSGVYIKEEPLSPSSSNSSFNSLPSSPESQFLIDGSNSPLHQPSIDSSHPSLFTNPSSVIKTEATLTPVKKEVPTSPACGVKPIQPMPITTVPGVNIQKGQVTKAVTGVISTVTNSNTIPVYIPCTGSIPTSGVVSVVVGNKVNPGISKDASSNVSGSTVTTSPVEMDVKLLKRQQRMIKNRESACLSRKKKKEYLQSLESKVKEISSLNDSLRVQNERLKRRVNELEVENTLLRSRYPDVTGTIKKSTCVLAVVLFIALNVGPFSNLKEQWKWNRADLLHNSVIHRGRALLNYEGEVQESLDKPLTFEAVNKPNVRPFNPVSKPEIRDTLPKGDPTMFNLSQKKSSTMKLYSWKTDQRELMVIKNKWDFLSESRQKRRNIKRKERNAKSRRKAAENKSKLPNVTIDDQFYCPSSFNKTEVHRLNEALEGWVRRHEDERILNQKKQRVTKNKVKSAIKELALRLASNCTSDVKRKINRHMFTRKHNSGSGNALQLFQRKDKFKAFKEEIDKKSDTLYVVSFHGDHLILPATEYNETQRPKMSFMIMAPPNRTEWEQRGHGNTDLITMMRIDCQVIDTRLVNIKRSNIPVPYPDSPYFSTPVSFSNDYETHSSDAFVKPAK